jgi:hypothetical protein
MAKATGMQFGAIVTNRPAKPVQNVAPGPVPTQPGPMTGTGSKKSITLLGAQQKVSQLAARVAPPAPVVPPPPPQKAQELFQLNAGEIEQLLGSVRNTLEAAVASIAPYWRAESDNVIRGLRKVFGNQTNDLARNQMMLLGRVSVLAYILESARVAGHEVVISGADIESVERLWDSSAKAQEILGKL